MHEGPEQSGAPPLALADLERALAGGLVGIGHVLTRGEWVVIQAWHGLSEPARALYARLFSRKDRLIEGQRLDGLYPEVPDALTAADELAEAGFAWSTAQLLPVRWHLSLYDRPGLVEICRELGLRRGGARPALEDRLLEQGDRIRPQLRRSGIRLRHRGLVRRICRAFLGRPDGDLKALVMNRIGVVRFADYTPAVGPGPYPDRRTLRAHEEARVWAHAVHAQDDIQEADLEQARRLADQTPAPPALRRFRARRYGLRVMRLAAERLEGRRAHGEAASLWASLVEAGHPGAARRLALCLERAGRPRDAARACVRGMQAADPVEAMALARTGRRLARKARLGWRPSPPLRRPDERRLRLVATGSVRGRPTWSGLTVERAVVATLRAAGRRVVRSENTLWTSLFGMLLRDVLFAPVPGMLPGACQAGPLDLGRRGFAERRAHLLEPALEEIRAHASVRLKRAFDHHAGEAIWGVTWNRWSCEELAEVCEGLGGPLLAELLRALATGAPRSGLPDLLVLPGERRRLPDLFPSLLPASAIFLEVKGPGDQLRDGQRVWLHRLLTWQARAEVWRVEPHGTPDPPGPG